MDLYKEKQTQIQATDIKEFEVLTAVVMKSTIFWHITDPEAGGDMFL
jgi:hypothetical protein